MQRYFVKDKIDNIFELSNDDSYHIKKVMRMSLNDRIEIVSNDKVYICEIIDIDKVVRAKVLSEDLEYNELDNNIVIAQSLVKEAKMDLILQKNTELGVSGFIPLIVDRSVVKLDNKDIKKIDRWGRIVKEASEQSKRNIIPVINSFMTIDDLCKLDQFDIKILCTVNEKSKTLKKVLQNVKKSDKIIIVVGPEGGFTEKEEDKLISSGYVSTSLGSSVLRTETASLFVVSSIRYNSMG